MGTVIYNFTCDDETECEDIIDQLKYDCAFGKCDIKYVFNSGKYHIMAEFGKLSNEDHTGIDTHFRADYSRYDGWHFGGMGSQCKHQLASGRWNLLAKTFRQNTNLQ